MLYLFSRRFLPIVFSARNKRPNRSYLDNTEDNQKLKAATKEVHRVFFNTLPPSVDSVFNPKNVFRETVFGRMVFLILQHKYDSSRQYIMPSLRV